MDGIVDLALSGRDLGSDAGPNGTSSRATPFGDFLIGPENKLVKTAVGAVLGKTANGYNPLVLHGPSGSGKSHLAQGMAAEWRRKRNRKDVVQTTAADFARELAEAIDAQATDDWRSRYRKARLLIFENLERLERRSAAQEELLHTLDAVLGRNGQVVVTAREVPTQLSGLTSRLRSRLVAGLTVSLVLPSAATRLAILRRLAAKRKIDISAAAVRTLAEGFDGSVCELQGALMQLEVPARIDGGPIDIRMVRRLLAGRGGSRRPSLREIAAATARFFSLRVSDLRSPDRRRVVVTARGLAMYLARHLTEKSLEQIGQYFGGRDHTTVMHGCRKTESLLETDPDLRKAFEGLQGKWRKR